MGQGHSYEHEFRESQREMERFRQQTERAMEEKRIYAENQAKELKRVEEEKARIQEAHRIHAENQAKELKRAEEEKAKIQEAHRIQAEKDRALAEKHEKEMKRVQEEKDRIQAENHERELRRMKAEKEEEVRRAEEEKKKLLEAHRMQEEVRKLQEKVRMEEERRKMEDLARRTEEEARKRVEQEIWLREEAERNLAQGIPAVKYPTGEEFQAMREKLRYQQGYLHIAITGVSGSGKSSFVNAVRGYRNSKSPKPNIAKTGTSETTEEVERYYDPDPSRPWLAWYDVPGAGTVKVRDWQYFNNQGLYIFDVIVILIGDRFTNTDVELLFHCKRFGIPAFVVRSKAGMHINNNMDDDEDSDENCFIEARDKFITDTRKDFHSLLHSAGLPQQKVYIVDKNTLSYVINGSKSLDNIIDEVALMADIIHAATERHRSFFQQA